MRLSKVVMEVLGVRWKGWGTSHRLGWQGRRGTSGMEAVTGSFVLVYRGQAGLGGHTRRLPRSEGEMFVVLPGLELNPPVA